MLVEEKQANFRMGQDNLGHHYRANINGCDRVEIGNGIASANAFPNATWERGKKWR
jgi:hypothetical protein